MTPEEIVRRAKELVDDPVLVQALTDIETGHFNKWRGTHAHEHEERERAWFAYQAVDQLRQRLQALAREFDVQAFNRRINSK